MNYKYFAGIFFLLFAMFISAQNLELNEGSELVYAVNHNGSQYDFILKLITYDNDEIVFNYLMTDPANLDGVVKITECAIKNAMVMYNYFDGATVTLDHEIAIWLSKDLFNDLVNSGSGYIAPAVGENWMNMINSGSESLGCSVGGIDQILDAVLLTEVDGNRKIWVLNDEQNPLIVKMDLGWTIELKEVK